MMLSELGYISTDDYRGTKLFVLGPDIPSRILVKRIWNGINSDPSENPRDYQIGSSSIPPVTPVDTLFVINDELTEFEVKKRYPNVHVVHFTTYDATQGYGYPELDNSSKIQLNESDWQALRNVERQLLAMHDAGFWKLPDEVRLAMIKREALRADL